MPRLMSVAKFQEAEEHVAQMREEAARSERETRRADLRRAPVADTAGKPHRPITAPLEQVRTMTNMRTGALEDLHELAVSIRETGLLHPPLVRATGEEEQPYELLAGQRRFAAMRLLDEAEAEAPRADWRFTLVDGISRREALTMQFAENFHQSRPEPVQFARAARLIMAEDPSLTAADVSRIVGAPPAWTRKALGLLELPEAIVERVEQGDLSFTAADFVRRGIARGDVTPDAAEDLVERHVEGALSGIELKYGVGYVPPPPENYEEVSARLDAARRAADAPPQRDEREEREERGGDPERVSAPPAERRPDDAELDGYVLGAFLFHSATERSRKLLRIAGEADAHAYARSLHPHERLRALRSLAREALEARRP
jgi:ParB/RepB/Spo0J family partition protein